MAVSQYNLIWNSYKNNICNGFAKLQQKEEFVDMTLVAGGHLVKVHKNIVALASPYIKNMILSAPCEHPVIFLSSISHEILCYILEYIYTGEVKIETDKITSFINAATELHITGITNDLPVADTEPICVPQEKPIQTVEVRADYKEDVIEKDDLPIIDLSNDNHILNQIETDSMNNFSDLLQMPEPQIPEPQIPEPQIPEPQIPEPQIREPQNTNLLIQYDSEKKSIEVNACNLDISQTDTQVTHNIEIDMNGSIPQQYTVSKRGSLQLILNRYMYCMHHQSLGGKKRRWRCIDYRLLRCPAFIDTMNDQIINRQNIHSHPYHDEKIIKNIKKNLVFGSINIAIQKAGKLNETSNDVIMDEDD